MGLNNLANRAIDLRQFLDQRAQYLPVGADRARSIEFGFPRVHFESLDTEVDASCCLDWRAEIHLEALTARDEAPRVVVGHVDFLVLQLGEEPAAEVLDAYGEPAADFGELFDGAYLDPALEGTEAFVDAHITTVLAVLEAAVDEIVAGTGLRAWALAQVINTMLPTIAGLVVMKTSGSSSGGGLTRRLMTVDRIDQDWPRVGCIPVPGYPQFYGRSTEFTYLGDARNALENERGTTVKVPVA